MLPLLVATPRKCGDDRDDQAERCREDDHDRDSLCSWENLPVSHGVPTWPRYGAVTVNAESGKMSTCVCLH